MLCVCLPSWGFGVLVFSMLEHTCNILNWNVRGLNNPARRKVVRDLVSETRTTIVTLQETKLDFIDAALVSEILGHQLFLHDMLLLCPSMNKMKVIIRILKPFMQCFVFA